MIPIYDIIKKDLEDIYTLIFNNLNKESLMEYVITPKSNSQHNINLCVKLRLFYNILILTYRGFLIGSIKKTLINNKDSELHFKLENNFRKKPRLLLRIHQVLEDIKMELL